MKKYSQTKKQTERKYSQIIKKMEKEQLTLKQLKLNTSDIVHLKNNGCKIKDQYDPRVKDYVYYIIKKGDMAYIKISDGLKKNEEVKLKLLEISDMHCGCNNFDMDRLR